MTDDRNETNRAAAIQRDRDLSSLVYFLGISIELAEQLNLRTTPPILRRALAELNREMPFKGNSPDRNGPAPSH